MTDLEKLRDQAMATGFMFDYVTALVAEAEDYKRINEIWFETGANVMEVAVGRRVVLSDSEVTSVIEVLRTQLAETKAEVERLRAMVPDPDDLRLAANILAQEAAFDSNLAWLDAANRLREENDRARPYLRTVTASLRENGDLQVEIVDRLPDSARAALMPGGERKK